MGEQLTRLEQIAQRLERLAGYLAKDDDDHFALQRDAEYLRALDARTPARRELTVFEQMMTAFVPGCPDIRDVKALDLPESAALNHDQVLLELKAGDRMRMALTCVGGREIRTFYIVRRYEFEAIAPASEEARG